MMGHDIPPSLVALLRCPVDGSPLRAEPVEGGVLLAGASRAYPVVLGIPRLIDDAQRRQLVALLRAGQRDAAERLVLAWPNLALAPRLRRRLAREVAPIAPDSVALARIAALLVDGGALREPSAGFIGFVRRHAMAFYTDWFIHRFSARTFLPIQGLAPLLPRGRPVLEIGNGCGHSTFVLARELPGETIIAVDHAFAQLYAAKRFLAPGAHHVCADVERGLPLAGGAFGAVVMNDTFHFVRDKPRLVEETGRVAADDAMLVLSQIHNGLFPEAWAGQPLSPDGYATLLAAWSPRIIRNDRLIAAMTQAGGFDLDDTALVEAVESEVSLSLVGHRGAAGGRVVHDLWDGVAARRTRLLLNPLLVQDGAHLALAGAVHPVVAGIMAPPDLEGFDPPPGGPGDWAADPAVARELLRRRILLDVPADYA